MKLCLAPIVSCLLLATCWATKPGSLRVPKRELESEPHCGNGIVGSGQCEVSSLCCSLGGWCGVGPAYCIGSGTCGSGSRGNGICPQEEMCCSQWGHCGFVSPVGLPTMQDFSCSPHSQRTSLFKTTALGTRVLWPRRRRTGRGLLWSRYCWQRHLQKL